MYEDKFPTELLLKKLFKTPNISFFVNRYGELLKYQPFNVYVSRLCSARAAVPEHIISKSGIARTYGHQIFNGLRRPSRDKVIQIAFGFEMNYEEIQELLRAARKSQLYPKIERDAVIIFAIHKGLSVAETQKMLNELNLPVLGKEDS